MESFRGIARARRRWFRLGALLASAALAAACHGSAPSGTIALGAPFSERSDEGWLAPRWTLLPPGENGAQVVEFSFTAQNRLRDPLYLRLSDPRLLDGNGKILAGNDARLECRLHPGDNGQFFTTRAPLRGVGPSADSSVRVDALAIPLAEPGRAMYREWAWLRRPNEIDAIDAELRAWDALPFCDSAALAP